MSKREIVDYENHIGQTISPGDNVAVVTVSTGNVHAMRGTFLGTLNGKVQVEVQDDSYRWVNTLTGEVGSFYSIPAEIRAYRKVTITRVCTLQRNRVYKIVE